MSTNISDLPKSTTYNPNVQNEVVQQQNLQQQPQQTISMPTTNQGNGDVNDMFNALQNTNTSVPIRNIPTHNNHIVSDQQVKANYIPEKESNRRFVEESNYDREVEEKPRDISWLEKFQIPLLIIVIGVILQMKQVNDNLFKFFPSLFSKEGVLQTNGIILKAVLGSGLFMLSQHVFEDML